MARIALTVLVWSMCWEGTAWGRGDRTAELKDNQTAVWEASCQLSQSFKGKREVAKNDTMSQKERKQCSRAVWARTKNRTGWIMEFAKNEYYEETIDQTQCWGMETTWWSAMMLVSVLMVSFVRHWWRDEHPPQAAQMKQQQLPDLQQVAAGRRGFNDRHRAVRLGDGNCYWRAVGGKKWKALKRGLKARFHHDGHSLPAKQQLSLDRGFRRHHWNNAELIQYTAAVLKINIQIHQWDATTQSWTSTHRVAGDDASSPPVRLAFNEAHYDRLRGGPSAKELMKKLKSQTPQPRGRPATPGQDKGWATDKTGEAGKKKEQEIKMARPDKQKRLQRSKRKPQPRSRAAAQLPKAAAACDLPAQQEERERTMATTKDHRMRRHERSPRPYRLGQAILLALGVGEYHWTGKTNSNRDPMLLLQRKTDQPEMSLDKIVMRQQGGNNVLGQQLQQSLGAEGEGINKSHLAGGAMRSQPTRARTQRIIIDYEQEQHHIFVPQEWTCGVLAERIPLHFGQHPQWTDIVWNSPNHVTMTMRPNSPSLTTDVRALLLQTCESLIPSATERKNLSHKDLYLGHRASRAHGLTVATRQHQETVRTLNAQLKHLLPEATWSTIAVLAHRNVPLHQDSLSDELSYAINFGEERSHL